MTFDAQFSLKLRPEAKRELGQDVFLSLEEVFELDVKAEAKRLSPVKTGYNRNTIDTEVKRTPKGVEASLFSQSGYGGYLEVGTAKMAARPYLYPAVAKYLKKIQMLIKRRNSARKG